MAGGTDRNQPLRFMYSGPPVMDRGLVPRPAAGLATLALVAITHEHLVADTGEIAPGMAMPPVAGGAKTGGGG